MAIKTKSLLDFTKISMDEKIILIDGIEFIKNNLVSIAMIVKEHNGQLLPLSEPAYIILKNNGFRCIDPHDFEYESMYNDVYSTALKWGMNWYRTEDKDISCFNNYSFGNIIEWQMVFFFASILKNYLLIKEIIKKNRGREIIFINTKDIDLLDSPVNLISTDIPLLKNIIKLCIKENNPEADIQEVNLTYPKQKYKRKFYFIRPVFCCLNMVMSSLLKIRNALLRKKKIAFFEGFHHFFNIMAEDKLKKYFGLIHIQKAIGPSILFKLYLNGIRIITLNKRKKDTGSLVYKYEEIKKILSDYFFYDGVNISSCIWPRIEFLYEVYFPRVISEELNNAIEILISNKPDCLVVENDATYYEKMLVIIAKKYSIPTVVIQHGTIAYVDKAGIVFHDFYPLTADKFFAWGKVFKDWFIKKGVAAEKILITGAARLDQYYAVTLPDNKINKNKINILILLNDYWKIEGVPTYHIKMSVIYRHINKFIALAEENPQMHFIIRPHHSEDIIRQSFKKQLESLTNLVITRKGDLIDIFKTVDLVIGYFSTALIEAAAFKLPIISLDTGEYCNFLPLWEYGMSERVCDLNNLDIAVKNILRSQAKRQRFIDNYNNSLSLFNFNNDGRATQMIVEGLSNIVFNKDKKDINNVFLKKALFYISANYIQQILGFITSFCIRRFILPVDFGIWTTIKMVMRYCEYSNLGIFPAIYKEIPFYIGKNDYKTVNDIKNLSGSFIFTVAVIISIGLIAASFLLNLVLPLKIGLRIAGIMFFFTLSFNYCITLLRAYNKFIELGRIIVLNSVIIFIFYISLSYFWHLYGLYTAAVLSLLVIISYAMWKNKELMRFHFIISLKEIIKVKFLLKTGIGLILVGVFYTVFITSEKWVIIKFLGFEKLGYYSIAMLAFEAIYGIPKLIGHITFSEVQNLHGKVGKNKLFDENVKKYTSKMTQYIVCLIPIVIGMFYIWGAWVISNFIPKYAFGINSMNILLIGALFIGLSDFSQYLLTTLNKYIIIIPLLIISTLIVVLSSMFFISKGFGIEAVALSAVIGHFVFFVMISFIAFKNIHSLREITIIYTRIFLILSYYAALIFACGRIKLNHAVILLLVKSLVFIIGASPFVYRINKETDLFKKLLVVNKR